MTYFLSSKKTATRKISQQMRFPDAKGIDFSSEATL